MTLKFYTLFTLLFVVLLGNFVYFFISTETAALDIFGIHFTAYPIAIWVTVPLLIFYLINVVLMSVSNIQSYFRLRNYERDFEKLKDAFYHAYLHKERKYEYKTRRYRLLGDLVASTQMMPKPNTAIEDNAKIQAVFSEIEKLQAGEVADLKRFSLSKDNPLMIQNAKNRLHSDAPTPEKILNAPDNYDDATTKEAYASYVTTADIHGVLKYKKFVSIRSLLQITRRVNAEENAIELSLEDLLTLSRSVTQDINQIGFIEIAMAVRSVLIPEERIKLFETLAEEGFEVSEAMLYTLLDLEMIDKAREMLENFASDDFPKFRAFIALKDADYSCSIDLFVTTECP
jgi:hypothetical protein